MEKTLNKKVREFMNKKVISVQPEETVKKLFNLMEKHAILGLPVVDKGGQVVGIVTETDLISHFTTLKTPQSVNLLGSLVYLEDITDFNKNLKDHCAELVKDMMTINVVTALEDETLIEVVNRMAKHKVSRLPVVNKLGKLTGIITRSDIVHELSKLKSI